LRQTAGGAGVIDQHVEAARPVVDQRRRGVHALVVGDVDRDLEGVDNVRSQLGHGLLPDELVAIADADAPAERAQSGGDLVSDSQTSAGDQRNCLIAHEDHRRRGADEDQHRLSSAAIPAR
jgi:hypothetical protein